jgi:NAD(P)H-dependent flavin oxidoreductase YrpB (nitropropane dioxygenase family)
MYVQARHGDVVLIKSPVGLPGRGLRNSFYQLIEAGEKALDVGECNHCLKRCSQNFCLRDALNNATRNGDFKKALVFAGEQVEKIKEILPVHKIFENLLQGVHNAS